MRWFAVVLLAGVPALGAAQGFGIYEHGACAMGRAGTAVAHPCPDGSAIFFNPAGLVGLDRRRATVGATLIQAEGSFTDDLYEQSTDLDNPLIPVPNGYFTYAISAKATVGIGVFAPYGLETRWPTDDFAGRFLGYNSRIRSIYVQPTVAYAPHPRIKIGVGVAYIYSDLELHQRVDFSGQQVPGQPAGVTFYNLGIPFGTDVADASLQGSGTGFAVNVGAIVQVSPEITVGARFLSSSTIDYDGDAEFMQIQSNLVLPPGHPINFPGLCSSTTSCPIDNLVAAQFNELLGANAAFIDGGVQTTITMPAQASVGVAYEVGDGFRIMGEWQYVLWSAFDRLPVNFSHPGTPDFELYEGYNDTHGVRVGMEYDGSKRLTIRGGFIYHTGAAPDETVTPLLPEGERNEVSVGVTMRIMPQITLDAAYHYVKQNNRRGRVHDPEVGNTGIYSFAASLFGLGLSITY